MDADLDTLATAPYVTTDDLLKAHPERVPWRPAVGIQPRVTDDLIRPTRSKEQARPGQEFLKPLRQIIESIFDTLKGQLDLERHEGRSLAGVSARISQRLLALTTAIWHNDRIGAPVLRSLTAYDH